VKTINVMLTDNTGSNGELDTDAFQRAMGSIVTHQTRTPNSLRQCACFFPIKDFIPIIGKYTPHPT